MTTVLLMKIGGRSARGRVGIHGRHIDDKARITYVAVDEKREVIPKVTYIDDDGKRVEFVSKAVDATPEQLASGERREMDCMDCHNRPSHIFTLPERALDQAMEEGRIATDLPYAKKTSVELLRADYRDRAKALERIPEDFVAFYRSNYPELLKKRRAEIDAAAATLCGIYAENVFPSMKVGWGTYANHIGHEDDPGCFRCHDDEHNAEGGQSISQDCESCHIIFDDPKILAELGLQ